jgi:tetratricopeptide (TPR) repeat protein
LANGDADTAVEQFEAAKRCWPNCTEQDNAPELLIAAIHREQGRQDDAILQLRAYCKRTARAYAPRWALAERSREAGDREDELLWLEQCNQIDPFRRELHVRLGECHELGGRLARAAMEFEVGAAVLPALDRKYAARGAERPAVEDPAEREERGGLLLRAAKLRDRLGERERAYQLAQRVAKEWPASKAADEARALCEEWRPR